MRKVFGIGLSKTGTTSLSAALAILGYRSKHFPKDEDFARYDAFSDITVAMKFKTLDRFFPGSQFIYTVRDEPAWLASRGKSVAFGSENRTGENPSLGNGRARREDPHQDSCNHTDDHGDGGGPTHVDVHSDSSGAHTDVGG